MDGCERLVIRDLTPDRWPDVEKLFGSNGGCGGCWCQWWRIAGVEHWKDVQGEVARGRLCRQVQEGSAHGVLAFEDGEPVGWCSFEPRSAFPRLQRSPSFKGTPTEGVWFVGCFFVRRGHRHRGIAELLLSRAVENMGRDGARVIEACPKDTHGRSQADAFVYTGTCAMFERQGFQRAETCRAGIAVMRRRLVNRG